MIVSLVSKSNIQNEEETIQRPFLPSIGAYRNQFLPVALCPYSASHTYMQLQFEAVISIYSLRTSSSPIITDIQPQDLRLTCLDADIVVVWTKALHYATEAYTVFKKKPAPNFEQQEWLKSANNFISCIKFVDYQILHGMKMRSFPASLASR
ncbi:hypothetical protein AVEN_144040-1 [Araneus ventricosus]|uniref:Uncharacterized protein n=1 Tax=Araneus ventricosus TaxID=182803 RepID=A0A4Y2DEZ6_ARAVE|nr:hypothetical protein AVEN_144040-1 [Araneus ventricosus]